MATAEYLEQGKWRSFDFLLVAVILALSIFGVISIYSANMNTDSPFLRELYIRQIYWFILSFLVMGGVVLVDYRILERMAYPIYIIGSLALILVDIVGVEGGGSQRWLSFGGLNLQPSEFMKITVIILMARMMDDLEMAEAIGFRELIWPTLFVGVPFFMVAKQPDLGTAMIYLIVFAAVALFNGVKKRVLLIITGAMAICAPIFWIMLKPYQKGRILTTLNPEADPMGQGYQTIQSKIAIGSGGLWGKGVFEGTQSKLNFLPAKHTDFVFSVVAEEIGFVGCLILLGLFFFLIMRLLDNALHSKDKFGSLISFGVVSMITFNILYNIGMSVGLFPIVGVPLPFISYGGSASLTNFIAIGLVLNVSLRRFSRV